MQRFPLEESAFGMCGVSRQLQSTFSEMASWMELVGQQLADCVLRPVDKLHSELDLVSLSLFLSCLSLRVETRLASPLRCRRVRQRLQMTHETRDVYHETRGLLSEAEGRFAKLTRKDSMRKVDESNNDHFFAKKNFHEVCSVSLLSEYLFVCPSSK